PLGELPVPDVRGEAVPPGQEAVIIGVVEEHGHDRGREPNDVVLEPFTGGMGTFLSPTARNPRVRSSRCRSGSGPPSPRCAAGRCGGRRAACRWLRTGTRTGSTP